MQVGGDDACGSEGVEVACGLEGVDDGCWLGGVDDGCGSEGVDDGCGSEGADDACALEVSFCDEDDDPIMSFCAPRFDVTYQSWRLSIHKLTCHK